MTASSATAIAPAPSLRWRRWSWLLALLVTAKVLYMGFFLTPPGDLPDESGHYSYTRDIAHGKWFPLLGEATIPRDIWFERLEPVDPERNRDNYIVQHPPLYYMVAAVPYAIASQLTDDRWYQIRATRIVSAVSLGLLIVVLFKTLGDLGVAPARALPMTAVVGFIPMISHLSSGITNDIFLFLMCALATRYLVRFLLAHRMPDAYLCAVWLTLAGATKMTAWPLIAGFLAILLFELRQPLRRWFLHAGGLSLVTLALPIWWAARNIYHFGDPMKINVVRNFPLYVNYSLIDYLKAHPFLDWMAVHSYGLIGFSGYCATPETSDQCMGVRSTRVANHAFEIAFWFLAAMALALLAYTLVQYLRQYRVPAPLAPTSLQGWLARLIAPGWLRSGLLLALGLSGVVLYAWSLLYVHREGDLGWLINPVLLSATLIALPGLGVALFDDRGERRFVYYALALFFCYGMLIVYQSHKAYILVAELRGVQGRYFFPFLPMLIVSMGLVLERLRAPALLVLWMGLALVWGEMHSYIDQLIPFFEQVRI